MRAFLIERLLLLVTFSMLFFITCLSLNGTLSELPASLSSTTAFFKSAAYRGGVFYSEVQLCP